jgi:NAD(P)-dependent dehydrogenase (short-subunit alcohol dehydrogenase family)
MEASGKAQRKRVIVTGSGTGIGREIALEYFRQGASVAFHYSHSADGAMSAVAEARRLGGRAEAFRADFNQIDQVQRFADEAMAFLGGIDILVNNAGITFNKPFLEVTAEQFTMMYNVNIRAQFFLTQKVVAKMLEQHKGAICNLTSIHGVAGAPEHSVYAGTKGAIIAYTRSLAVELACRGVRVNAVAPGWVNVENYYNVLPGFNEADAAERAKDTVPIARPGKPLDIARLVVFLCSDDAEYIVGQTIVADGGSTALMSLMTDFRSRSTARFGVGYLPGV